MSQTEQSAAADQPTAGYDHPVGIQMKRRGPVSVWLLMVVTVGIYGLVWYYKIHRELGAFDPRRPTKPWLSLLAYVMPIASFVTIYRAGERIRQAQETAGVEPSTSPVLGLVLAFFSNLHMPYYQSGLNKIIDRHDAPAGTQVPLAG